MKQKYRLPLILFSAAAAILRLWQRQGGFESTGLAVPGNLPGRLLPAVLLLSAAYFLLVSRSLPELDVNRDGLSGHFTFQADKRSAILAVTGVFIMLPGAGFMLLHPQKTVHPLLGIFAAAAAVSILYVVFSLYRGDPAASVVMLVPVCCAGVFLFWAYRSDASDPVLQAVYIRILASAGLTYNMSELAAFAFRNGSPRRWTASALISIVLCAAGVTDGRGLASVLLFAGGALVELSFLTALRIPNEAIPSET